ncbi:hypothetical protein AJ80_04263 [Polytolypa hystricis UAMH7299]|uniref:G-protein coupled receptors family 2 profile 2 domain-containing protein n=1 Tax=Polytolypa hystricis (strain UAMH7299) TaxID=1447883 RepID=A0A2B7YBM2_POLH7|nr:hypothetical protein AJ80_04263 [Polytolypa hystricis UAMH7299]
MTSNPDTNGLCPVPFMQQELFPTEGGFLKGRLCNPFPGLPSNVTCCLPCPHADWRYPEGFVEKTEVANWLALVVFILNCLMLLSFAVLPTKWTHRHYLGVCLAIAILFMELAFIVPLGARPEECFNDITPNDMKSDLTCAFSGAFIIFGGFSVVMWSFCRALSLHLQICWDVIPGNKFFYGTLVFGWGLPAAGLAVALIITGTSYRFGSICHINHDHSIADFWGPLMGFSAAALVIQFVTLAYCVHVYIKSLLDNSPTTDGSSGMPQYTGSVRTLSTRQAYRRVRRVIQLQWRGIAVVLTIIGNVIFFTVIFISLDNSARGTPEIILKSTPWLACLATAKGDRNQCVPLARELGPNEAATMAVLILLSLSGMWTLIFLGRFSMILGWIDLVKRKIAPTREFVSADARDLPSRNRAYEMLSASQQDNAKSPEPLLSSSPSDMSMSTLRFSGAKAVDPEAYGREQKYTSPVLSFSTPRPPSATHRHERGLSQDWDPQSSFAQGRSAPPYWYGDTKS